MERRQFPSALELITGKFLRHSQEYYRWRIADRIKKLQKDPQNLALYDDLAVAYDKVGEHKKAIETILKKDALKPGMYKTIANLGTFYIHDGQLEKGLEQIRRAIKINPDAHFGREVYQQLLVEYVLERRRGRDGKPPLQQAGKNDASGFSEYVLTRRKLKDGQDKDKELERAIKGVLGMMRFGKFDSPILLSAVGDLLAAQGTHTDRFNGGAKRLAARAYLKASYEAKDEAAKRQFHDLARWAINMQAVGNRKLSNTQAVDLAVVEERFQEELKRANAWYAGVEAKEKQWIAAGADVDAEFGRKYYEDPTLATEYDDSAGWPLILYVAAGLGVFVVTGLAILFVVIFRTRRKKCVPVQTTVEEAAADRGTLQWRIDPNCSYPRDLMTVPKVAIVGRPNVGKSSLMNWLARKRVAVVDPTAGVTRDRVTYLMHEGERYFELVDTGGMGIVDVDDLSEQIEEQIRIGLEEADLILFVVDAQSGVTPLDAEVARRLRPITCPKLLVINKCDSERLEAETAEFLALTNAPVVMTSVKGNRNRQGLTEQILEQLPEAFDDESAEGEELSAEPEMKLAIVGRRNVGKSTFINAVAEAERVIVSEIPGTTRDSVDVRFTMDDRSFVAIDTPGVRKRKSIANNIEYYGLVRAKRSIRRADVVLMFFDAEQTISKVDKQLVEEIHDGQKPCIFVVNKWDLGIDADMTNEKWADYLFKTFGTMRHVPAAFITAKEGKNIRPLINLAQTIFKQARIRVPTRRLNDVVNAAVANNPPPHRRNRRPRIYYVTQVAIEPPTIVLKCNEPRLFDESWKRYLLGVLREELPFHEVPIRLYFRSRSNDEAEETDDSERTHA
eukprot:g12551.t1